MNTTLTVIDHPLVQHKLSFLRDKETPTGLFRQILKEVSLLLAYEVTKDLPLEPVAVETPLATATFNRLAGKKLCLVSILRAGNGLLEGMLDLIPSARVCHVGLYRDPKTLEPVEYYFKAPEHLDERRLIVVDPMLATGGSAAAAVSRMKEAGAKNIKFVCLVAAPEGVSVFSEAHPDVPIFTAALDEKLDDHSYIVPGLGDAGDRIYGTK
ncbi:MAG: uracil phosphoribosyltransferase [Pseudomonadota bacterium]